MLKISRMHVHYIGTAVGLMSA